MTRLRRRTLATVGFVAVTALAACSGGGDDGGGDAAEGGGGGEGGGESITVWTGDTIPERVAATEAIIADFTAATGIEVEFSGVDEDQFNQVLTSAAAAGELPDVAGGISLAQVRTLAANELVDTETTAAILETLGEGTFSERALEMTREGDEQLAIPSESWAQLLYYRSDLFEAAGLDAPETYEDILAAAEALNAPPGVYGFVGANLPGDAFTQQTFEHIALGNNCQMVDDEGEITFDSEECVAALEFYGELLQNHSTAGAQDVDTVRASYFAGQAAMAIWSTFLLDELAGLREDAKPSCPECLNDPTFLSANTGVVTAIQGPDGDEPAQFGEITSWAVTADAASESAQAFIEYMLTDGYEPWIAIAPEGKVPVRLGTEDDPTQYADTWATLPVGVDTKAPLADFYGPEVLERLQAGPEELFRWGITQGQGNLVGAAQGQLPVATAVNEVTSGADPQQAAETAAEALRSIQDSLQ